MHVCFVVRITKEYYIFDDVFNAPFGFHPYKYDGELVRSMKSPTNCFSLSLSPCQVFFSRAVKVK